MQALGLGRISKNTKSTLLEAEGMLVKGCGTKLQIMGINRVGIDRMENDRVGIDLEQYICMNMFLNFYRIKKLMKINQPL